MLGEARAVEIRNCVDEPIDTQKARLRLHIFVMLFGRDAAEAAALLLSASDGYGNG